MTSKNLFFKLMKEDLKRRMWAVALIGLASFFVFPVPAAFMAGSIEEAVTLERGIAEYTKDLLSEVSFSSGLTMFGMVAASLICGLSSFSYLNSKSKVDFYHGIPVRREKLYAANYLNGILILAIPYGICLALAVVIGISNGVSGSTVIPVALTAYGLHLVYYILMYSTVVIAAMMTGNLVVGFLGCMVFAFVIPMVTGLARGYFSIFYHTYVAVGSSFLYDMGMRMSPILEYAEQAANYRMNRPVAAPAFAALLVSAVLAVFGCFLYRKRPSEAAGKAMAFSVSRPINRVVLTMVSALGMGAFFWEMRESMAWAVFGVLCGAVVCHCVIEIIYHFDFRMLFSNKLQLAGCIVAAIAVLCVFRYDLTGYDTWTPKAGSVKSAAIEVETLGRWVSYGTAKPAKDGTWEWSDENSTIYMMEHMECQDVENIVDIAKAGIQQVVDEQRRQGNEGYSVSVGTVSADGPTAVFVAGKLGGTEEEEEEGHWSQILIRYTLNSGRKVCRRYHVRLEDILPQMDRLMADQQYLQGAFPVMVRPAGSVAAVHYREGSVHKTLENLTPEQKGELLAAYQKDFASLTIGQMYDQAPIGLVRFTSAEEEQALGWMKQHEQRMNTDEAYRMQFRNGSYGGFRYNGYYGYPGNYEGWNTKDYYPVYPSFTKTLALLKEFQIDAGTYFKNQEVDSIRISGAGPEEYYRDGEWYSYVETTIRDPEEVDSLMDILVDSRRTYYNPFYRSDDMGATLIVEENGAVVERTVLFPKGKVPSFVIDRLEKID